jgi:hypothetical protein
MSEEPLCPSGFFHGPGRAAAVRRGIGPLC